MANRYQEDLKLIVGVEGSKSGNIPGHKPKDKIKGRRGIVYFNADGSSSSATGNTPGTDEEGNKEEGTLQPAPGAADTGTSGGAYNGGNTLDGAGLTDPYPIDDPALPGAGIYSVDSMTLGDIVNGVSGLQDCATGDPVDVRFDGQFTAPDGWEDADTPPPISTHDGVEITAVNGCYILGCPTSTATGSNIKLYDPISQRVWMVYYHNAEVNPAGYTPEANCVNCPLYNSTYFPGLYKSIATYTSAPADPDNAFWPADKPTQLSFNAETGLWETHPMDSNVLPQYSQPVSSLSLCNEAGDSIQTFQLADGGQAIYNDTTGIATFIDADGKVTGFGGAAEITNRQPR